MRRGRPINVDPFKHYTIMSNNCWLWKGAITGSGYGSFKWEGKQQVAHKVFYEQKHGKVPYNLQLDHTCRNRDCVNPDHLEVVTCRENLRRGSGCKITQEIADKIRYEYRTRAGMLQETLSVKYGISRPLVSMILNDKIWK